MKKITTEPAQATFLTRDEKIKLICKKIERLRRLGQLTSSDFRIDRLTIDGSSRLSDITAQSPSGPESDMSVQQLEKFLKMSHEDQSDVERTPATILIEQGYFPTFPTEKHDEVKNKSVTFRAKEHIIERLMRKKEGVRFESQEPVKTVDPEVVTTAAPYEEIESNLADIRILMHELYVDVPPSDCAFDKRMPHEFELPDLKPKEEAVLLTDDSETSQLTCSQIAEHKKRVSDNGPRDDELCDYVHPVCEDRVTQRKMKKLKLTLPEYKEQENEELKNHLEKLKFKKGDKPRKVQNKNLNFEDLDYVAIMNAYEGNWAVDEDAFLSNLYFKFLHDSRWRRRIKKYGCYCLIDECTCGRRQGLTDAQMSKLPAKHFFELETLCDYTNVVERIRHECHARDLVEKNVEFLHATDPANYSDSEVSEEEIDDSPTKLELEREACLKEIREDMGPSRPFKFAPSQRIKDEESILGFSPRDKLRCGTIPTVKFTQDIAPVTEWKNIEDNTLKLYADRVKTQIEDIKKGIKWRGKTLYRYKWPRFGHKQAKN